MHERIEERKRWTTSLCIGIMDKSRADDCDIFAWKALSMKTMRHDGEADEEMRAANCRRNKGDAYASDYHGSRSRQPYQPSCR